MLTFVVSLRCGRYTVNAEELRFNEIACLELWGFPPATAAEPYPAKRIVAAFPMKKVLAVVAKEHLIGEEGGELIAPPVVIDRDDDAIPF